MKVTIPYRLLMLAFAFALLCVGSAQASFLVDLATNANKVASSPYATGGDVILHLQGVGYDDYVHVFTNTASAGAFTPSQALTARLLLVAGGGGGGNKSNKPGGGGAGGMIEVAREALSADTPYAVTIGSGSVGTSQNKGTTAGDSSFVGGSVSYVAVGGGRGSDYATAGFMSGGSGGGAGSNNSAWSGGSGKPGQGHDGGSVAQFSSGNGGAGGGGGAGAPGGALCSYVGSSPLGLHAGIGGDGLPSDILGFSQYFAGGGGGYSNMTADNGYVRAPGGLGGGGSGGIGGDSVGEDGEDGLGGGGGGGLGDYPTGRGGSGIVAVRYLVWTSNAPLLRPSSAVTEGGTFVAVTGAVGAFGAGESSALVKMRYWKTSTPADTTTIDLVEIAGEGNLDVAFSKTVGGFDAKTEYGYAIYAAGANDASAEQTGTFTTFAATLGGSGGAILTNGFYRIHVFDDPRAPATFTTVDDGYVDILVVGGGGAGGYGAASGGGGGGGVVYSNHVYLAAGAYAVTVGTNGTMLSGGTSSKHPGGNSSFADIIAYGGGCGVGWDDNTATGSSGGSGGGGSRNVNGSQAGCVYGQGHQGGNVLGYPNYKAGGGGGAGGRGADGSTEGPGAGGPGYACSITGETVVYGSGGGGGARIATDAMAPGGENGGHGACWTIAATSGVDGTGGGGGGGCGASSATKQGGAGGCGTVIVRYIDCTLLGDDPAIAVEVAETTPVSAVVEVSVPHAGASATVTLSVAVSYEEGGAAIAALSRTVPDFIGPLTIPLAGLSPGRTYFVAATADNGTKTATATTSFTTDPMFTKALSLSTAGGVLSYTMDGASDGTQTLELWVGPDEALMTNLATYADASLMTAGSHTITPFTVDFLDETMAIMLRHVAVAEGHSFTNDSAVLTATLRDGATYTWNSEVSEGDWCDAANWIATAGAFRGWPAAGSTAKFPAMTATARVDRAVTVAQTQFTANGAVTLKGTVADATLTTGFASDATAFPAGSWTLDAIAVVRDPAGKVTMNNAGETLVLTNGASFANAGQDFVVNNGGTLTVGPGSSLSVKAIGGTSSAGGAHPRIVVAGTVVSSGGVNLSYGGAANKPSTDLVLKGAGARIEVNGVFYAEHTNATVTIELEGTYSQAEALIRETGTTAMAASGGTLTFDVPRTRASKSVAKCDILVADWSKKSINTALVAFGEHEEDDYSYFFFTESADLSSATRRYTSAEEVADAGVTVQCLWYRHKGPGGFHLSVR